MVGGWLSDKSFRAGKCRVVRGQSERPRSASLTLCRPDTAAQSRRHLRAGRPAPGRPAGRRRRPKAGDLRQGDDRKEKVISSLFLLSNIFPF